MKITLDEGAYAPTKAHDDDAGWDLRSMNRKVILPGGSACFNTVVHVELPSGTAGLVVSKSGLNIKHDLTSTGLIDQGYTGSIVVKLYNHGNEPYVVEKGDKISQLVIIQLAPVHEMKVVNTLAESDRGDNGFGSSGR